MGWKRWERSWSDGISCDRLKFEREIKNNFKNLKESFGMKKFILLGIVILSFIVWGNDQIFKSDSKEYFIIKGKNIVNQKK